MAVAVAAGPGAQLRVGTEVRAADHVAQRRPVGVIADGDREPRVVTVGGEQAPRRVVSRCVIADMAAAGQHLPGDLGGQVAEHHLGLGDAGRSATAAAFPAQQQRHRAQRPDPRRNVIGVNGDGVAEGVRVVGVGPQRGETRRRANQRSVAEPFGPRPAGPERRTVDDDDTGVDLPQRGVVHAKRFCHPGFEVTQYDVGSLHQTVGQRTAVVGTQVDSDRSLVAVTGGIGLRHPGQAGAQPVGKRRRLDLDDVGPQVGEKPAGVAADHDDTEVQYPQTVQRESTVTAGAHRRCGRVAAPRVIVRSRTRGAGAAPVDLDDAPRHRCAQAGTQFGFTEEAACVNLLGAQCLGQGQHRGRRHTVTLPGDFEFVAGFVGAELFDCGQQPRRCETFPQPVETRIGEFGGASHPLEHAPPLALCQQTDPHVTVLAFDDRVTLLFCGPIPALLADRHTGRRAARRAERRVECLHRALEYREVDALTDTAA